MNKHLNNEQKRILRSWKRLFWEFAEREWMSVLLWSAMGALTAGLVRLLFLDQVFRVFIVATYFHPTKHFDDIRLYLPYALIIAVTAALAFLTYSLKILNRGLRSWIAGVTSGLSLLPFISILVVLTLHHGTLRQQLLTDLKIVAVFVIVGYLLRIAAMVHGERTLNEDDLRVPTEARSVIGTAVSESDDPIQSWQEDALGRASLVESISSKLIVAKIPVLALFGEFGSGKSSTLNLLREHLRGHAIVVSFSTWLPGSQETLTSYLLGDISNECQRNYIVPGLSKSTRRLASALAQSVPFLKGYPELFPATTQKGDVESLGNALSRLPKRVIVLLDELDRMEREELLTLLKVIRGISSVRNLSFVCATDRATIYKTVKGAINDESNKYFEKFFPASVQVPAVDADALRRAGTKRLTAAFVRRGWFESEFEVERFRSQIDGLWEDRIAPFCCSLRAIGLLANDVGAAAAQLRREVNPVDLTLIELLRRFKPLIYDIVARNSTTLTGAEKWGDRGLHDTDEESKRRKEKLLSDIENAMRGDKEIEEVNGVLSEMFPRFARLVERTWLIHSSIRTGREDDKRIDQPGIFPAYFRYELPQGLFSSVELEAFIQEINRAGNDDDLGRAFVEELTSMEKGSPKRDDFLRKLSEAAKSLNSQVGSSLVHSAMRTADKYVYDQMLVWFGEAGHVLTMTKNVTEKLPTSERAIMLSRCIEEATDDTMALRVLSRLAGQQKDFSLGVTSEELYSSFSKRMRLRYGPDVDAANIDLSTSDKQAFNWWGSNDRADRELQHDFWLRYIGRIRSRLARVFESIFMPIGMYTSDPTPIVENKISTMDLNRLYETLGDDEAMTDLDRKSLRRMKRFLDGEFKNGISPEQIADPHDEGQGKESAPPQQA
jgi:KAP family P-loop domain